MCLLKVCVCVNGWLYVAVHMYIGVPVFVFTCLSGGAWRVESVCVFGGLSVCVERVYINVPVCTCLCSVSVEGVSVSTCCVYVCVECVCGGSVHINMLVRICVESVFGGCVH